MTIDELKARLSHDELARISHRFDDLILVSQTLNNESNDLNKTITTINNKLAGLNLGFEIFFEVGEDLAIGYAKVFEAPGKEQWQLATLSPNSPPQPLLKASRNLRIEGLKLVPQLLEKLKTEAEQKIAEMKRAKELAAQL